MYFSSSIYLLSVTKMTGFLLSSHTGYPVFAKLNLGYPAFKLVSGVSLLESKANLFRNLLKVDADGVWLGGGQKSRETLVVFFKIEYSLMEILFHSIFMPSALSPDISLYSIRRKKRIEF